MKKPVLVRISTVPHSLDLLLKGQMAFMTQQGFEVIMISSSGPEVTELAKREGCQWINAPLTREFNVWKDFKALIHLVKLFHKIKPDIVHSHSPKAGAVGQMAAWICRVPLRIHTVAGLPLLEVSGIKRKILDSVERMTYKCAHWVLPNSKVQAEYLLKNNYLKEEKLKIIGEGSSNGIDLDYFSNTPEVQKASREIRKGWNLQESDFILVFVGRLANYKGVNELVRAHVNLLKIIPNSKLVLVGPFEDLNPLDDDVRGNIEKEESIFTTGHVEDIRPYLGISDVFVFPSYREGFPQSLMQATAMGLPCVATNINVCN
jgi:glycosyltransferase involved in cell wall biosynthesis